MPRSLLTNAIQDLRLYSAEARPPLESPRTKADDAGRFRWDSWARSGTEIQHESPTSRTFEHHALMLQTCLNLVLNSRTSLFSQATWSFRSGGFQRMRTIGKKPYETPSNIHMNSTRCSRGNLETWTEIEGANASSRPRHDSDTCTDKQDETPLKKRVSHRTRIAPTRLAQNSYGGLMRACSTRALQNQSVHVNLPLGA